MAKRRWLYLPLAALPLALAAQAAAPAAVVLEVPKPGALARPAPDAQAGFPKELFKAVVPGDNAQSPEKIALGEKLFFDPRLSADGTVACATCHDPDKGFTDHRATSVGIGKQVGHRNAPSVLNALYSETQFWDGRAAKLEDQAKLPILNPIEMGQKSPEAVMAAVAKIPEYTAEFQKIFGRPANYDDLARAIAAYERTQTATASRFDRFISGDEKALDAQERRGWALFNGKGRCMSCHAWNPTQPTFSDNKMHNIGVSAHKQDFVQLAKKGLKLVDAGDATAVDRAAIETDMSELGRFLVTKQPKDIGAFKTPTLRNLLVTEPYFHDGSQDTLWDTMDHYNKGGVQNPFLDGGIQRLGLTESEIDDLVAFLATLTSDRYQALAKKELARQKALSKTKRPQRDVAAAMGKNAQGPGLKGPFGDVMPNATDKNPADIGGR
jgi:cytochrome c peroxidase